MSLSMTQILILIMKHSTFSTNLHSTNTRHTRVSCVEIVLTMDLIVKYGPHLSMSRARVAIKTLVITKLYIILRVSHNSSTVVRSAEFTPPQPLPLRELKRRELITYMIKSQERFDKTLEQIMINQEKLNMDFQKELNRHREMMNLRNSNQDPPVDLYDFKGSEKGDNKIYSLTMEPSDTFLMGDKVTRNTPERENDEFIMSSVDDLVLIPNESEVTSIYDDLKCSMPLDSPPSPRLDVLGERKVDIDLPFEKHLDTLSKRDREINFNPRDIETNDLILVPWVFDEPLGYSDLVPRSYDVTFLNHPFDFNDDYTLCYDNPLFDDEFEDISSLDLPESTPVIDESSLLVTPPPAFKKLGLREVGRFDPFFFLTQSGEETRVMEIPSFGFHHMPSPCPVAYSPKEVMYHFYHPHLTSGDGFDPESKSK
uniref:NAC domain-containing protein n=1 Tax=Tanacetum cinerariifolium TaxID=118510 RepID=A0A699HR66_TANCI|nr:hypothetical protein [Tanacetum cinerariifolium]